MSDRASEAEGVGVDHRRRAAQQSVDAILDAAEVLLARHEHLTISAVADEAGVSRVTIYAHFSSLDELLEKVVERAVQTAAEALASADPDSGPAPEALERLIAVSWQELARHSTTASAAAERLSAEAVHRSHGPASRQLRRLLKRGRQDGAFRRDVSADWLVIGAIALMHTAAEEVRAERMRESAARHALISSIQALWAV